MRALLLGAASLLAAAPLAQQELPSLDGPPTRSHQFIAYASDQQEIPAGKRAVLEVRFQVEPGFHVNSHVPSSDLLIATKMELQSAAGVKLAAVEYPTGKTYTPSFDPSQKLDVYADSFVVKAPVTATVGAHELHGTLRYQACDRAVCYPAKVLPVTILFRAK